MASVKARINPTDWAVIRPKLLDPDEVDDQDTALGFVVTQKAQYPESQVEFLVRNEIRARLEVANLANGTTYDYDTGVWQITARDLAEVEQVAREAWAAIKPPRDYTDWIASKMSDWATHLTAADQVHLLALRDKYK